VPGIWLLKLGYQASIIADLGNQFETLPGDKTYKGVLQSPKFVF
jgi:hypothetical protein